jgi:hypothetical protein
MTHQENVVLLILSFSNVYNSSLRLSERDIDSVQRIFSQTSALDEIFCCLDHVWILPARRDAEDELNVLRIPPRYSLVELAIDPLVNAC